MAININGTTGISGVDGSAGTPAIQGSDTNTGVFFGTNTIDLSTDGTSRLSIGTDGDLTVDSGTLFVDASTNRVGIGTTSPSFILDISGSSPDIQLDDTDASGEAYRIQSTNGALRIVNTGVDERLRLNSLGHLGIGTTSPSGRLDVRRDINGDNPIFFRNMDTTASSSAMTTTLNFNFNRTSGGLDLAAAQIRAGKEREWVGAAANQDGFLAFFTTGNETSSEAMRITSDGKVRIGMTSFGSDPSASVGGTQFRDQNTGHIITAATVTTTVNHHIFFNTNGAVGSITTNGSGTSFNESSDYRLKENVVAVTDGITRLKQLKPSRYNFIADPTKIVDGFIAHEVQDVVPEAVNGEKDAVNEDGSINPQGIDKSKLVPLLTAALQEAITKIEILEARLSVLEGGAN